jgi:hypothetical protein
VGVVVKQVGVAVALIPAEKDQLLQAYDGTADEAASDGWE